MERGIREQSKWGFTKNTYIKKSLTSFLELKIDHESCYWMSVAENKVCHAFFSGLCSISWINWKLTEEFFNFFSSARASTSVCVKRRKTGLNEIGLRPENPINDYFTSSQSVVLLSSPTLFCFSPRRIIKNI